MRVLNFLCTIIFICLLSTLIINAKNLEETSDGEKEMDEKLADCK
jgi:hypothetical protein